MSKRYLLTKDVHDILDAIAHRLYEISEGKTKAVMEYHRNGDLVIFKKKVIKCE